MRPISLEMEGFTSFRQRVTIDFSRFDLFAITGPTGSGKTSIIDAMTYVLYGCTTRLGKQSISELISQGADRLKVMLEFSSGKQRFRISRSTKWTGRASSTDVRLEEWNGEKWVSLADRVNDAEAWTEKIVGLDFNGFTKSVVLPQGQFDVFLKGKPEERRRILSELLSLDVYQRMMKRANEIAADHKKEAGIRESLLGRDYAHATPEHLARLEEELDGLRPRLEPLSRELDRTREALAPALELRQARLQLARSEADLKKLGPEQAAAETKHAAMQQRIKAAQKKAGELEARIKKTSYDSALRDELFAKLHKAEQLDQSRRRLVELEEAQTAKSKDMAKLDADLKRAQGALDASSKKRDALQKKLGDEKKRLEALQKTHGTPEAIKNLIVVNQQRLKVEGRLAKLREELNRLTVSQKRREDKLTQLKKELSDAESALADVRARFELLQQQHAAREIRRTLKTGAPCPVCEQPVTHLPRSEKHPSLEQARKAIDLREGDVKRLVGEKSALDGELREMKPQFAKLNNDISDLREVIDEAASTIRTVLKKAPSDDAHAELEAIYRSAAEQRQAVDQFAEQLESARETESEVKKQVEQINRRHSVAQSENSRAADEIKRLKTDAEKAKTLLGKFADLSLVRAELQKQDRAKQDLDELNRAKQVEADAMIHAKDEFTAASVRLEGLRSRATELESARAKAHAEIEDKQARLASTLPDLEVAATGVDLDAAAQLEQLRAAAQSKLDSVRKDIHRLEEQVRTVGDQIKRAAGMRVEMESHRKQEVIAHELALSLHGDQFIAFIQQQAYQRLATDGSSHLNTVSSGRYSFGFDKDEFVVLDHWNADAARPVTTLSGGESFLASLALALALAEGLSGLSHGRGRFVLESLFLDEGFGTLDPETLDDVLSAIETLGTTDRLVGIVSHIAELADRVPSRIQVRKAVGGSSIEIT